MEMPVYNVAFKQNLEILIFLWNTLHKFLYFCLIRYQLHEKVQDFSRGLLLLGIIIGRPLYLSAVIFTVDATIV